eukprot:gnl/MRDRNA2_/MRDRNA2_73616_c0_seq1.p1 gnl/MRDRNA2_/MRDRNA2_73616_c0~~gnl/MRDRNA2_/MRDRNA2_73616_c0_seq1.p1  ORF type:complete len:237 (-),score=66.56 gnl/MRDRNA2_/MRDRNA2_73616_c0_seq1:365-1075(-)
MQVLAKCLAGEKKEQFLLLGLDGAGKTTLFWRLRIKDWKRDDLLKDIDSMKQPKGAKGDPGYHYEEFTKSGILKYGMWDVPGGKEYRLLWPTFYRYIRMSAVIFVIDALEAQDTEEHVERMDEIKVLIHNLLAEDELRNAAFIVIINDKKYKDFQIRQFMRDGEESKIPPPDYRGYDLEKGSISKMLGLDAIEEQEHNKRRFSRFMMDIADVDGESSKAWKDVLEEIKKVIISVQA